MHIRHTAAALTLATLALTACTATDSSEQTDTKPKASASKPKAAAKFKPEETAFLMTTRAKVSALEKVPDEQLLQLGKASCEAIDAGNSPATVAATAEKSLQIGDENSGYLVGAAVSQFCPEHKSKL